MNDSALFEAMLLENWDNFEVFFYRPGLVWLYRIEFCLEVNGDFVVADAFDESKDFFKGLNFGAREDVLLRVFA